MYACDPLGRPQMYSTRTLVVMSQKRTCCVSRPCQPLRWGTSSKAAEAEGDAKEEVDPGFEPGLPEDLILIEFKIRSDDHYTNQPLA